MVLRRHVGAMPKRCEGASRRFSPRHHANWSRSIDGVVIMIETGHSSTLTVFLGNANNIFSRHCCPALDERSQKAA